MYVVLLLKWGCYIGEFGPGAAELGIQSVMTLVRVMREAYYTTRLLVPPLNPEASYHAAEHNQPFNNTLGMSST